MYLECGRVACRFEDLTFDTPRNRLVRAALELMGAQVGDPKASADYRRLGREFRQLGVGMDRPIREIMSLDRIAGHQIDDRLMVTVARLALDLALPSKAIGGLRVTRLERDEALLRRIFEKAVAGFYRHEFHGRDAWKVRVQPPMNRDPEAPSARALDLLPSMRPDLVLEQACHRRIVLDTKFASILTKRFHGGDSFKRAHIYQLYTYLGSQAGRGGLLADSAEVVLLYPSLDQDFDENLTIQGHRIRFVAVNLASKPNAIFDSLRSLLGTATH